MTCKNCIVSDLQIEIKSKTRHGHELLLMMKEHLSRRNIPANLKDDHLFTNEIGATSIADFSGDHIGADMIFFRILDQNWRSIDALDDVIASRWIDQVIQKRQIHCHYQPIVTANQEIYAYELLARFTDNNGETIYPNVIFDAARQRGRLYALDRLCRFTAVRHATVIPKHIKAFINFIPTSIYSPEFCLRSTTALAKQLKFDTKMLVFEVVETDKVEDVDHLKSILQYYQNEGFQYALDDVGDGYSTIDLLSDLQPNIMKLDMKYVQGVASDSEKQQSAQRFLNKANEIGSIPLAEGIETEEDFHWLKHQGYQLFQGYLFGKPSPSIG